MTAGERIIKIDNYYTCQRRMERIWEETGRQYGLTAKDEKSYMQWKAETRKLLGELLGLQRMESCPLHPQCMERVELQEGIIREKILLQVEPEVWMPVYVLIPPKKGEEKQKCYLAPPGHLGAGKYSVAGRYDIPAVAEKIELFHYDYGMQLAKRGYVALCNDSRGFGERREAPLQKDEEEAFLNSTCFHLSHMAEPLGQTVIGQNVWDLMRLVDYIEERDEWDSETIGCLGFSGGGMQTLWLAAMDDRIKKAGISGYFYGYQDSLLKQSGNCSCNYVPHLWEHVDMGDIGALIAPRPVMIQSCRADKLNGARGLENVESQMKILRQAYGIFGAEGNIFHDICEGGHCFHEEHLDTFLHMM